MTQQAIEAVIGKAVMEDEFREVLFANPDEALAGYELTDDETVALKSIDAETLESFAGALDDRISKSLIAGAFDGESLGMGGTVEGGVVPQHFPEGI